MVGLVWFTATLIGTKLNSFTAKTTVVDADVITTLDSASSYEAKKTTLAQLWTYIVTKLTSAGYLIGSSLSQYNYPVVNASGVLINGQITESPFGFATDAILIGQNTTSKTSIILEHSNKRVQFRYNNNKYLTNKYWSFIDAGCVTGNANVGGSNSGLYLADRDPDDQTPENYIHLVKGGTINFSTTNYVYYNSSGTILARLTASGLAIGSSTVNSATQLDLQSTSKGAGLPVLTNSVFSALATRAGNTAYNSDKTTLSFDNGTSKVNLAKRTDVFRVLELAPLNAVASTVAFNRIVATGALPSTSTSGVTTTYTVIDAFMINYASTINKLSVRLTQACTDQSTVGSNPTVRIDVYKATSVSRTLIATYRVPITTTAGIGTSTTLGTLTTGIDATYELTGLSDSLAVGDLIGAEFVPESGTTKIVGVTNLTVAITTLLVN